MEAALRITQLWKSYGKTPVIKDLSLEIHPGEIFGLLGPNGAGKSTTINIVSGVARLERGKVEVFGYDNQSHYKHTRRLVGVMHQEIVIDPFFRIGQALKIHAGYYGCNDDPQWRDMLIDRLALGPHLEKSMNKLSGGMKRRFMVAKALIHKPRLLILDEPTAGVDVELRRALWQLVREINSHGTTVLLTTHYLEEAEQMCGRVAIMSEGQIVALDTTRNLMSRLEKRKLSLLLKAPLEQIPAALAEKGAVLDGEGKRLEFRVSDEMEIGDLLQCLFSHGLQIADVETSAPSLEDVFVRLTGHAMPVEKQNGEKRAS